MGAAFRLPLWLGGTLPEVVRWCRQHGAQTVCADIRATKTHTGFDWTRPAALVLGAEAHGLNEQERDTMNELIRIPMRAQVESLNVAVAAGITLYEAARQRAFS
jgi:TrmH family RNA methyltransferase